MNAFSDLVLCAMCELLKYDHEVSIKYWNWKALKVKIGQHEPHSSDHFQMAAD